MHSAEQSDLIYAKWEQRIRAQGLQEGVRQLMLKLLDRRFGPLPEGVIARVQQAGCEELDHWAEHILSAETLEDVLARRS